MSTLLENMAKAAKSSGGGGAGKLRGAAVAFVEVDMDVTLKGCEPGIIRGQIMTGRLAGYDVELSAEKIKNNCKPADFANKKSYVYCEPGATVGAETLKLHNVDHDNKKVVASARWLNRLSTGQENDIDQVTNALITIESRTVMEGGNRVPARFGTTDFSDVIQYRSNIFDVDSETTSTSYDELLKNLTDAFTNGTRVMISATGTDPDGNTARMSVIIPRLWDREAQKFADPEEEAQRVILKIAAPADGALEDRVAAARDLIEKDGFSIDVLTGYQHGVLPEFSRKIMDREALAEEHNMPSTVSESREAMRGFFGVAILKTEDKEGKPVEAADRSVSRLHICSNAVPIHALPTASDPKAMSRYYNGLRAERENAAGNDKPGGGGGGGGGAAKSEKDSEGPDRGAVKTPEKTPEPAATQDAAAAQSSSEPENRGAEQETPRQPPANNQADLDDMLNDI